MATDSARKRQPARATIRDIASHAGVSVATVSRVLNDRPDVSAATRELVLRSIREHDFTTNRSARALSLGKTTLIGLAMPNWPRSSHYWSVVSGAITALHERDKRVVLLPRTAPDSDRTLGERLREGMVDGAILVFPSESNQELKALLRRDFPFVVFDFYWPPDEGIASVTASHWAGAKSAVEHLLSLGHHRIGAITGPTGTGPVQDRLHGYHAALAANGVPAVPELVVASDFTVEGGRRAGAQLLALPTRPTAIFAFNDEMAAGVIRAAHDRALHIPRDLSVVGFDDCEVARVLTPALTSVRQPLEEMGRVAVSLLDRLLEGQPLEAMRIELATKLIVRESTAPPRG
ncbi:MAG: LacI family DNA-binding transcriptional regulator [Gaiellaceae bacterium]